MDNLEDNAKYQKRSLETPPDSRILPTEDSSISATEARPVEVRHRPERMTDGADTPYPPMPMEEPMPFGPSAKEIIEKTLRFKWTLLLVSILIAAPLIMAIWYFFVPQYRASAEVRIQPIIPYLVFKTEESGKIQLYDLFVNTQVRILKSSEIIQRVLDQPQVQQTDWYRSPRESLLQRLLEKMGKTSPSPAARLGEALSVATQKDTEIVQVSFSDANTKDAQLILNTLLDQYMLYIAEMSDATQDKVYAQLVDQHKSLENEIRGEEDIINGLQASLGTSAPADLISQKRVRLDETQARLADTQQKIDLLKWELDKLSTYAPNDVSPEQAMQTEKQPPYSADEDWRRLNMALNDLRHQMEVSPRTARHPDTLRLVKDLKYAEQILRQREAQLDEQWRSRVVPTDEMTKIPLGENLQFNYEDALAYLKHQLGRAEQEEQLLLADVKKQRTEFEDLFKNAQLLERQSASLQHKRELFDAVRQRLDQKNMERNAPGSVEILMRAAIPPEPFNDKRIAFTVMVMVLALGTGGAVAFWRASKCELVYSTRDLPQPLQIPFLGQMLITDNRRFLALSPSARREKAKRFHSNVEESLRVLRTALLTRLNGSGGTAILVTSATAGTGKSHFTVRLGESLARAGKKVLVIDADFRKMTLTKRLDLCEKSGFIQFLRCRRICQNHIVPSESSGLGFMPVGEPGENNVVHEEIANGAFKACMDKLRGAYDIILLDSSPILGVADASILSGRVDGTIMVEREFVSKRSDQIEALERLASSGGYLLGTVFVGSDREEKYGY